MNQNIAATHAQQMQAHSTKTFQRINSIDLLRGLIMIIMALDHTRDYFHTTAWTDDPLNLQTTTPTLFFTRWITHVCAPNFVFLAGTSAWFQSLRKSKKELSIFLIKRGVWLIFVDLFIFNFAFSFDPTYTTFAVQTLWAIGIGMFFLGLAVWLPFTVIFAIGIIIVFGHNLLDTRRGVLHLASHGSAVSPSQIIRCGHAICRSCTRRDWRCARGCCAGYWRSHPGTHRGKPR